LKYNKKESLERKEKKNQVGFCGGDWLSVLRWSRCFVVVVGGVNLLRINLLRIFLTTALILLLGWGLWLIFPVPVFYESNQLILHLFYIFFYFILFSFKEVDTMREKKVFSKQNTVKLTIVNAC
jgi:hypothetical protein